MKDKIFDGPAFEKFLVDHIKVDGKTGQLGEGVTIAKEDEGRISVSASIPFSKRYLKYLVKRFLKRNLMRDWLRSVFTKKTILCSISDALFVRGFDFKLSELSQRIRTPTPFVSTTCRKLQS